MAHKYIKVPFSFDTKQEIADKLDNLALRYATEEDYEYFTVDVGSDVDGVSEQQIRSEVSKEACVYYVDHKVRDDHFKENK
jgi:hypothetical protein